MTPFRKMQGLGNDFAVFDARTAPVLLTPDLARQLADRHFGIGCDTVDFLILPGSAKSDAILRFFQCRWRQRCLRLRQRPRAVWRGC